MAWESHRKLEARGLTLTVLTLVAVVVGGLALLIPPYFLQGTIVTIPGVAPYGPLELTGRDIYIREGCNTCHSQQVRPLRSETDRYGPFTMAGEVVYDRPFLFGSRRTGPDLARVGGKYPNSWHWIHFHNPRDIEPRSNMPAFAFLEERELDTSLLGRKLEVLRTLGHPYSDAQVASAEADARARADEIAASLRGNGIELSETNARSEAIAVIAYLQSLGKAVTKESLAASGLLGGAK
ncbi:MAG TPA: cytochrome-c oxidase, cbb3-type subunit II [Myxococcota bacterium]|nr:cytochrome-c oxidase, cbb3-type subunit II [Myxococcota bacterium]